MRRFLIWAGVVLATPVLLFLLLTFLLYLPPVQDFAVRQVTSYVSEQTGFDVRIERLRLSFPLDLDLQNLCVTDGDRDTLVAARHALVDLDLAQILALRVGIDAVTLEEAQVNTKEMIASMTLRGSLERFTLHDDVDLRAQQVVVSRIEAHGLDIDIALRDTITEEDTTSSVLPWQIEVERVDVSQARLRFALPGDSLWVQTGVGQLSLDATQLNLEQQTYRVGKALVSADSLQVHLLAADSTSQAQHFVFHELGLSLDSILFDGTRGYVGLPAIALTTPSSRLKASASMDLSALQAGSDGALSLTVETDVSRADIVATAGPMLPVGFASAYPDVPLHLRLSVNGNMDRLALTRAEATLPGSLYLDAQGELQQLLDSTGLKGRVDFNLQSKNLNWVRPMLGGLEGFALPPMQLGGSVHADGPLYQLTATLQEGSGLLGLKASADTRSLLAYDVTLSVNRLNVAHFMPRDSIGLVTATLHAKGFGTDVFSPQTLIETDAAVKQLQYGHLDLSGLALQASVAKGRATATLHSDNRLLRMDATAKAMLQRSHSDLTFGLDLSAIDLYGLGLVADPLQASVCMHLDGSTNLSDRHQIEGTIGDITLLTNDSTYFPDDIALQALLRRDTIQVALGSGDFHLTMNGGAGYERILSQLDHFTAELSRQMKDRRMDLQRLKDRIPQLDVHLRAGTRNPVASLLASMGYGFHDALLDLEFNPLVGINGGGHVYGINTGSVMLDTTALHVFQDSTGVKMNAHVRNSKRNPHITFDARLNAYLDNEAAGATLTYIDEQGRTGVNMGVVAELAEEGFRVRMSPLNPIIAYRKFQLNDSNFLLLGRHQRIDADIDLLADDGTRLKLYSSPNFEALQDLTVEIQKLNLGELTSVIPYAPRLTGFLQGDAHLVQTPENMSVSLEMDAHDVTYERAPIGQLGLEAVYLPNADGSHFVDGNLLHMGLPVASFSGSYTPKGEEGLLDVNATLDRFPLNMANGFIPDGMARLEGLALGELHVGGTTSKPVVNGLVSTKDMKVLSDMYSLNLRFEDDSILIKNSDLQFDRIEVYSTGTNPFVLDGGINFANLDKIRLDMNMAAKDYELINAKKSSKAVAYGKVYVDFNAMLRGTLDDLRMMGRLKVLGKTDVTYVLTDSPLTVDDQLSELVTFVDFSDTTRVLTEEKSSAQNLTLMMNVSIDEAAHVHCLLSPDGTSYVDLEGGGDLVLSLSPEKDMQMNGRYTIQSGTLKYTMMVIPLKEFTIKSGSYVEFRGPLMNPVLNLSATERMRTTVTENEQPRSVAFDVGMNITQTLSNLGLEFTLEAPEDMSIQNDLASMSAEARGRMAVTMLATGMYLPDGGSASGGFTTQNALNSFLQGQISNIAGKALKSVDVSMGLESGTTSTGATTTDFSFRFAKRFWGNRVSVIVGGKVSTGEEANTGQSLIDNVSIEYRLDQGASRYVKVYYDRDNESLFDGEIMEMGAGLVLRRKTKNLGELFLFRNSKSSE